MEHLIFADGTSIEINMALACTEGEGNSTREILTVLAPKDAIKLDALDSLLGQKNKLELIQKTSADGEETGVYEGYCSKMAFAVLQAKDEQGEAAEVISFRLGRPTRLEERLAQLEAGIKQTEGE